MLFLFQATPYEQGHQLGEALGRVVGACCCLGVFLGIVGAIVSGVVFLVRRSRATSAAPAGPPDSHYRWNPGAQPDFAASQAQQEKIFSRLAPDQLPETDAINQAARKLVTKDFDGAIAAYEDVAQRFPHRAGDAHSQIGAAWFYKGDYDRALFHYRRALELGASPQMMDDNIREAEEAKQKRG